VRQRSDALDFTFDQFPSARNLNEEDTREEWDRSSLEILRQDVCRAVCSVGNDPGSRSVSAQIRPSALNNSGVNRYSPPLLQRH
jgi:hypothetical protein